MKEPLTNGSVVEDDDVAAPSSPKPYTGSFNIPAIQAQIEQNFKSYNLPYEWFKVGTSWSDLEDSDDDSLDDEYRRSADNAEDSSSEDEITRLPISDIDIFGTHPGYENLLAVICKVCHKIIKAGAFASHMESRHPHLVGKIKYRDCPNPPPLPPPHSHLRTTSYHHSMDFFRNVDSPLDKPHLNGHHYRDPLLKQQINERIKDLFDFTEEDDSGDNSLNGRLDFASLANIDDESPSLNSLSLDDTPLGDRLLDDTVLDDLLPISASAPASVSDAALSGNYLMMPSSSSGNSDSSSRFSDLQELMDQEMNGERSTMPHADDTGHNSPAQCGHSVDFYTYPSSSHTTSTFDPSSSACGSTSSAISSNSSQHSVSQASVNFTIIKGNYGGNTLSSANQVKPASTFSKTFTSLDDSVIRKNSAPNPFNGNSFTVATKSNTASKTLPFQKIALSCPLISSSGGSIFSSGSSLAEASTSSAIFSVTAAVKGAPVVASKSISAAMAAVNACPSPPAPAGTVASKMIAIIPAHNSGASPMIVAGLPKTVIKPNGIAAAIANKDFPMIVPSLVTDSSASSVSTTTADSLYMMPSTSQLFGTLTTSRNPSPSSGSKLQPSASCTLVSVSDTQCISMSPFTTTAATTATASFDLPFDSTANLESASTSGILFPESPIVFSPEPDQDMSLLPDLSPSAILSPTSSGYSDDSSAPMLNTMPEATTEQSGAPSTRQTTAESANEAATKQASGQTVKQFGEFSNEAAAAESFADAFNEALSDPFAESFDEQFSEQFSESVSEPADDDSNEAPVDGTARPPAKVAANSTIDEAIDAAINSTTDEAIDEAISSAADKPTPPAAVKPAGPNPVQTQTQTQIQTQAQVQISAQVETPIKKRIRNRNRGGEKKIILCKDRTYNPDEHCGVMLPGMDRPCTRSLTCRTHLIALRRAVEGRTKPFDELLAAYRKDRGMKDSRDRKRSNSKSKSNSNDDDGSTEGGDYGSNETLLGTTASTSLLASSEAASSPSFATHGTQFAGQSATLAHHVSPAIKVERQSSHAAPSDPVISHMLNGYKSSPLSASQSLDVKPRQRQRMRSPKPKIESDFIPFQIYPSKSRKKRPPQPKTSAPISFKSASLDNLSSNSVEFFAPMSNGSLDSAFSENYESTPPSDDEKDDCRFSIFLNEKDLSEDSGDDFPEPSTLNDAANRIEPPSIDISFAGDKANRAEQHPDKCNFDDHPLTLGLHRAGPAEFDEGSDIDMADVSEWFAFEDYCCNSSAQALLSRRLAGRQQDNRTPPLESLLVNGTPQRKGPSSLNSLTSRSPMNGVSSPSAQSFNDLSMSPLHISSTKPEPPAMARPSTIEHVTASKSIVLNANQSFGSMKVGPMPSVNRFQSGSLTSLDALLNGTSTSDSTVSSGHSTSKPAFVPMESTTGPLSEPSTLRSTLSKPPLLHVLNSSKNPFTSPFRSLSTESLINNANHSFSPSASASPVAKSSSSEPTTLKNLLNSGTLLNRSLSLLPTAIKSSPRTSNYPIAIKSLPRGDSPLAKSTTVVPLHELKAHEMPSSCSNVSLDITPMLTEPSASGTTEKARFANRQTETAMETDPTSTASAPLAMAKKNSVPYPPIPVPSAIPVRRTHRISFSIGGHNSIAKLPKTNPPESELRSKEETQIIESIKTDLIQSYEFKRRTSLQLPGTSLPEITSPFTEPVRSSTPPSAPKTTMAPHFTNTFTLAKDSIVTSIVSSDTNKSETDILPDDILTLLDDLEQDSTNKNIHQPQNIHNVAVSVPTTPLQISQPMPSLPSRQVNQLLSSSNPAVSTVMTNSTSVAGLIQIDVQQLKRKLELEAMEGQGFKAGQPAQVQFTTQLQSATPMRQFQTVMMPKVQTPPAQQTQATVQLHQRQQVQAQISQGRLVPANHPIKISFAQVNEPKLPQQKVQKQSMAIATKSVATPIAEKILVHCPTNSITKPNDGNDGQVAQKSQPAPTQKVSTAIFNGSCDTLRDTNTLKSLNTAISNAGLKLQRSQRTYMKTGSTTTATGEKYIIPITVSGTITGSGITPVSSQQVHQQQSQQQSAAGGTSTAPVAAGGTLLQPGTTTAKIGTSYIPITLSPQAIILPLTSLPSVGQNIYILHQDAGTQALTATGSNQSTTPAILQAAQGQIQLTAPASIQIQAQQQSQAQATAIQATPPQSVASTSSGTLSGPTLQPSTPVLQLQQQGQQFQLQFFSPNKKFKNE